MKLYEIVGAFRTLNDMEITGPEDAKAFTDLAAEIQGTLEDKLEGCVKLIKNWEAEAEAFKAEAQRLTDRRRALENKADRLREYMKRELEALGTDKERAGLWTVALQKNPPALEVDFLALPSEWTVTRIEPDKDRIKAALKAGETVPGAALVQGVSLRIR